MPEPEFFVKTGDTSSAIYTTLLDANGDEVDISAADVRFKLAPMSGGTLVVAADATNAQNGAGTVNPPYVRQIKLDGAVAIQRAFGVRDFLSARCGVSKIE